MAVAGIPRFQPDHTLRVAKFALQAVEAANTVEVVPGDPEMGVVNIRVGFHSGARIVVFSFSFIFFGAVPRAPHDSGCFGGFRAALLSPRAQRACSDGCGASRPLLSTDPCRRSRGGVCRRHRPPALLPLRRHGAPPPHPPSTIHPRLSATRLMIPQHRLRLAPALLPATSLFHPI